MVFGSKSFGVRADVLAGILCSAVLGIFAGASRSLWLYVTAIAAAILTACVLSSLRARRSEDRSEANRAESPAQYSQADLDCAHQQFIETLAEIQDARDPYTAGHSIRVGSYAHAIALLMNVPAGVAHDIRLAAQLHDIGKIGIPDAILQKAGRLTPEEYGLIKLHPQIGRRILERMGRFQNFLEVVELHHENHDGTGYPYRLSGDSIPLAARIVHVADAFDAMVTNRHYRSALTVSAAILELRANSGTQFDPAIARVMMKLIDDGKAGDVFLPAEDRPFPAYANREWVPALVAP